MATDYKGQMKAHGFLNYEIASFMNAKAPDGSKQDFDTVFNSAPFQAMMRSREIWVNSLKQQDWSSKKIVRAINNYYRIKEGRSPFDFLKVEYKPVKQLSDYKLGVQVRAKRRMNQMSKKYFGVNYGVKSKPNPVQQAF